MASKKSRSGGTQKAPIEAERHFLLKLSDCCAQHAESHPAKPLQPLTEQDEIPERCQREMSSLCKILPRVEDAYGIDKNPHPTYLTHLCDFYQSVIQGRFCPHAPLLLEWGKNGTAVLPRIFSLYQHLVSKAILSNMTSVLKTEESPPVADTICTTIAEMMNFIPSQRLQECLVRDLIHLAFDLAVIADIIEQENSVQVSILEETSTECKLTDACVLTFSNIDSLHVTWSATLEILGSLLKLQRNKRLQSTYDETAESYSIMNLPTIHPDLVWSFVLDNGEMLSTAVASMRKVFLSTPPNAKPILVTRTKVSAAKLLGTLLEDWKASSIVQLPMITEAASLVTRAVRVHFSQRAQDEHLPTKDDLQMSSLCVALLCDAIIFPPTTLGSDSNTAAIRAASFIELLNCIPLITAVAKESPFVKDDVILAHVVLRAIHVTLFTQSDDGTYPLIATAINHCALEGIFPAIFQLLENAHLANVATQILSAMLSAGTDTSVDIASACRLAQNLYEKEIADVRGAPELTSPRSGSKRRGRSSQTSPYGTQQLQLRLERSPKRSRIGHATNSQATLATPSPPSLSHSGGLATCVSSDASLNGKGCHESLGSTLLRALLNAKHITGMVDPCRALFEAGKPSPTSSAESGDEISKAIASVSTGLCLLFRLIPNECHEDDDEKVKALLQVASLLAKSLTFVAKSLASHYKTPNGTLSDATDRAVKYVSRVGLEGQFTVNRTIASFPKIHRDTITDCLDAISVCAREVWVMRSPEAEAAEMSLDRVESNKGKSSICDGTCCKLWRTLSSDSGRGDNHWLPCLCKLLRLPDTLHHQRPSPSNRGEIFQNDCTLVLFERLSTRDRCAILSCLRPTTKDEDLSNNIGKHPMGLLFSGSPIREPPAMHTMLSLSPLFVVSAVLAVLNKAESSEFMLDGLDETNGGSTAMSSSPTGRDLVRELSSFLGRLLYGKYLDAISKSSALTEAAYLAVDRIHELCDLTLRIARDSSESSPDTIGPFLQEVLLNPLSLTAFILDCRFDPEITAGDGESPRRLRDSLYDAVQETYRARRTALLSTCATELDDGLSSEARIIKWRCLAVTCRRSTVSEMAQVRSRPNRTKVDDGVGFEADESTDDGILTQNPLIWLLRSAFADESVSFRFEAARDIGRVLQENKSSLLYAVFSTPSNWRRQDPDTRTYSCSDESRQCASLEHVVIPLFLEIDRLLCRYCCVPQSQLSFTMGPSVIGDKVSALTSKDPSNMLPFQRSAVVALSSLCEYADVESPCGLLVFEHAFARLIRLWTAAIDTESQDSSVDLLDSVSISALAFAEMARLNRMRDLRSILLKHSYDRFVPRLFLDILLPSTGMLSSTGSTAERPSVLERENRERQFRLLQTFIGSFLSTTPETPACQVKTPTLNGSYCMHCVWEFTEAALPSVMSAYIMAKDHNSLLIVIAFKLFLLGEKRKIEKAAKKAIRPGMIYRDETIGSAPRAIMHKIAGIDTSTKDLVEQTKLQCLAPDTIELILPRILMANDSSQLLFFLEVVLQKKCSLQHMISTRHKLILKTIVSEFGRTGDVSGAEHALRTAAKARDSASMSETPGSSSSKQAEENEVVCSWVSSSFMYLLVNVVQHHWKSRTLLERTRALRSLKWIIKFLSPSDAPQYLPQVMATVNMAMSGECSSSEPQSSSSWQLRLLAIQSLSEFIRTATQSQYETVGSNLATIVVSLFPVLAADDPGTMFSNDEMSAFNEASKVAVDLLEWLTQGDNGKNLASYFGDVPFLPPTKALDKVRDGLKVHGVSFDNLHVFSSTQNTQHTMSVRDSLTSEGASNEDDRKESRQSYSPSAQAALRRRLLVVRKLLSHENASVRRAVLHHLIDLLRANRGLFNKLIDGEERSSLNRFVTVSLGPDAINGCITSIVDTLLQRCCSEVDFETKLLLSSCLGEVGAIGAHRLGEMKVDPLLTKASDDSGSWRLKQAPWQSRPVRYELKVVTNHLVVALKAAPSSGDQHKIAFAIQQLLVLLDEHAKMSSRTESKHLDVGQSFEKPSRGTMSDWLREQLSEAGVIETIEPFWFSNFKETEAFSTKEPPFFQGASSYFGWLSYWCRYMLKRSNDDGRNQWCSFFYACRTAIRSKAGMPLAEFIVPLLVLDRICNGNGNDESTVINEFLSVFDFSEKDNKEGHGSSKMNLSERQKAVNCAFMVLDTLQHWAERETEERYHSSRSTSVARLERRKAKGSGTESTCWLWEESVSAIDRLLKAVPLSLQANAAAAVGMHARALRLMEMAARADVVQNVYDSLVDLSAKNKSTRNDQSPGGQKLGATHAIDNVDTIDTTLLKKVLGQLNDCETMEGIANTSNTSSALDDILVKEAKGDWSGALYDYERALELNEATNIRPRLEEGSLRCLLELGQLESVLHQVNGIVHGQLHGEESFENDSVRMASMNDSQATPFAVEAAWRLGRWSTLTKMLNGIDCQDMNRRGVDSDGLYRVSLGNAMQGLYENSKPQVISSIRNARQVLMSDLANVASESYSRSYPYLVRLHCLREMENACDVMCCEEGTNGSPRIGELASSRGLEGWDWNGRLAVIANAGSSEIIDVRLALSRLAGDAELEGSLYLMVGKKARKNGLVNIAANFLSQAEACCSRQRSGIDQASTAISHVHDLLSSIRLQSAKLKHQSGESTAALRILGLENVSGMLQNDDKTLQSLALSYERNAITDNAINDRDQAADINRFSRRLLQSTRWIVEGGIKGGSEVIERFRIVQKLSPHWEKGFFQFAKYIDGALESKISTLAHRLGKSRQLSADDDAIRQDVIVRDKSSVKYLLLAMEQYISALKYSSKHVYQALPRLLSLWFDFTAYKAIETTGRQTNKNQCNGEALAYSQAEANDLVSKNLRTIPAHCYYTAMSQLISRIGHPNAETVQVVKAILTRVLTKHPAQAMWSLAWLLHSADKERADTGDEIFKDAQTSLSKRKEPKLRSLLSSSRSLFRYLIDIAKYEPKEGSMKAFTVKTWRDEADLSEFIPPVQEALSVSPMAADNGNAVDAFPAMVPRMRAFCSKVHIMTSKAKPKKAKAFVVPADQPRSRSIASSSNNNKEAMPGDIGEMHFLVKREAKGDLRKDSRIQNLNSVINRLFAASSNNSGTLGASRQQRRLHLRTFAVTCLSEDCGILEWVPNTDSLRNLVMRSYNPQASPFSIKRRGRRIGNYGDSMSLKGGFEKCQSLFFKNGNLHQAAAMFEQICLKPYPPLLYWYFVQHFMDPHSWYEARTQFTLSCAAWSAVGHVIGLGDRHAENILVDTASGQCVHVDFDCIFDKGLNLPKPEIVPFRLSPNMIDAFGPIGADGVYTGGLKAAMTTLRDNRDTLLSVLEPFIKDPIIDWKRQKSSQRTSKTSASELRSLQAKRSITTIDERLKGIYNLHNPNYKKVKRTDGWSQDVDDEMMNMLPLSVEGQVHKMISEATSHENLVQLYVGWMPWV